jgi:hypothetical protein
MKHTEYFIVFLLAFTSCNFGKSEKLFSIKELYIGLSNLDVFKADKGDSVKYLSPPPPPFEGEIANNNIIESPNGKVYFYSFPTKQPLCGHMTENGKFKFELYLSDLDTLKANELQLIDTSNLEKALQSIIFSNKPVYLAIGLQKDTCQNKILVSIINKLYKNSPNNVWKIRKVLNKEKELLMQIGPGN